MDIFRDNKRIGSVNESTFTTKRQPQHFFRKYQGFGISQDILDRLVKMGIAIIKINYEGVEDKVYYTTLKKFLDSPKIHYFQDRDLQKFVSVRDMQSDTIKLYEKQSTL